MKQKLGFVMMFFLCAGILTILPHSVWANVHGQSCGNCHIMHNSQDGGEVVAGGALRYLLADSCIGCHTGDNAEIATGGTTPYVYNPGGVAYGTDTLAGGNFYWVATAGEGNHTKGHNVLGLSAQDTNIPAGTGPGQGAPGGAAAQHACANSCHSTLAVAQSANATLGSGCEGCHVAVAHHKTGSVTANIADEEDGWFRFCAGHDTGAGLGVVGIEDDDWQYTNGPADHNEYLGLVGTHTAAASFSNLGNTMTAYCCGCHGNFHIQDDSGLWIRHPSDAVIPDEGEYAAYMAYSTEAPVARPSLTAVITTVAPGTDMVMCLSCHRAHGSPYNDILRWDYDQQIAGGGGDDGTGCFTCHTTKDD